MATKKMKAAELVLDWSLWPRHEAQSLDSTNVRRLKEARDAGVKLPPVVANAKDFRVVDGFHRIREAMDRDGDDASISVELRDYESDAVMFLDAARMNAVHGLALSSVDRAHCIIVARRMKVPFPAISAALGMPEDELKEFLAKRSAKTPDGATVALKYGARALAGLVLTPVQEHYNRTANGTIPEMYARMLINALRADALLLDEKVLATLKELADELAKVLEAEHVAG